MDQIAPKLLETILNLSRFHREHEKFYAQEPLEQAVRLHRHARSLKALADCWQTAQPVQPAFANRYAGCEDLNDKTAINGSGILFLEGEGEPAEIARLKRELLTAAGDFAATGTWLAEAMEASWSTAEALIAMAPLADLLGERHRIIANDWQAAALGKLVAKLLERAEKMLTQIDFTPAALRADLAAARNAVGYRFAAAELIDRAADLVAESAALVHDNERRWRVFRGRVEALTRTA